MLERILDNYFMKKLRKCISSYLLNWYIDHRYINKNDYVELQIKKPHYKEETYTTIYGFYIHNSLYYLLDIEQIRKDIKDNVNKYVKGE